MNLSTHPSFLHFAINFVADPKNWFRSGTRAAESRFGFALKISCQALFLEVFQLVHCCDSRNKSGNCVSLTAAVC